MNTRLVAAVGDPKEGVMLHSDFITIRRHVGLHRFLFLSFPFHQSPYTILIWSCLLYDTDLVLSVVRYDPVLFAWCDVIWRHSCTIRSQGSTLYDINLRATATTIPSTWGVTILINLVSSATDSIR